MSIPTSTDFDLIDWNSRADPSDDAAIGLPLDDEDDPITSHAFMPSSDGAVPALIKGKVWVPPVIGALPDAGTTGLVSIGAFADTIGIPVSKQVASLLQVSDLPSGIPETYTFEFDLLLEKAHLPADFNDPNTRLFVGAIDTQGYTAGFLFSQRGIALATYPGAGSITILGGSEGQIINSDTGLPKDSVTVRAIVDGETGRMAVYINSTDGAYGSGEGVHPEYADLDPLMFSKVPTGFSVLVPSYATTSAGHYNIAALKSSGPFTDSVVVQATAQSAQMLADKAGTVANVGDAQSTYFHLGSLRLSSDKLYPSIKPVAVARSMGNVLVNDVLALDGSDSFDREGRKLQFNWEIEVAPAGSSSRLRGSSGASATLGNIEDDNVAVITFVNHSAKTNSWHLETTDQPLDPAVTSNANLSLTMKVASASKKIVIQLGTDKNGTVVTTALDIVHAFVNKQSVGFNIELAGGETYKFSDIDDVTGLTEAAKKVYPGLCLAALGDSESTGIGVVPVGKVKFSGGRGSSEIRPVFLPDKPGLYIFSLGVAVKLSGGTYSFGAKDFLQVTASLTSQLLEHRPASDYIWKYLPDFWNLVQDKQYAASLWSAMTQAISSDLLATWQNDYAKALKDVSQRYQRRWIDYGGKITFDPNYTSSLVESGKNVALFNLETGTPLTGTTVGSVTIDLGVGNETAAPPIIPGPVLVRSLAGGPKVVVISSVEPAEMIEPGEATSKWAISSEKADIPAFRLIDDRSAGLFIRDPVAVETLLAKSSVFSDKTYPMQDISSDTDVVRIYSTGEAKDVTVVGNITEYNPSSLKNAISLDVAAQPVSESFFLWDHLRRAAGLFFEAIPYFAFTPDFEGLPELDLDAYPVSLGDYAEVKLVEPYTNSVVVVNLPILARSSRCLFVDWLDLLIALNAHPSNTGEDTKEWSAADLTTGGGLSIELMSCTRARRRRPVDDLTSIPIIKSDTMDVYGDVEKAKKQFNYETSKLEHVAVTENVLTTTVLYEGMDYRIKGGSIAFEDYLIGKAVCTAGNPVLVLEDGLITHEMFRGEATLDELGASCVLLFGGDSGIYKPEPVFDIETESAVSPEVGDILFDMKIAVSPAPRVSGTVDICIPRFCAYTPVPGELWAEVSYFDNWQTIENNFGMFVGFPKSLVDAHDPTLDYLSVIKSLWFAFMNGPDFENLDLAVEAFFNVPFSDVACQVVYVDEGDVTIREKGKIVVYETEEGRYRTYTYPSGASLAINPRSSKLYGEARRVTAYKLISSEEEKEALSEDERKLYEDSILDPYTKFIDFADIVDYVLDPELIDRQLQGEDTIKKYHTFLVDVPLSIAGSTKVFPLVKAFLSEARPAYTNFILVGSFKLEDAISAVDEETLMPTLHVKDTPHTAPFFAQALDVDSFELPIVSSASEGLLWPQEKTEEKGFVHIFKVVPGGVGSKAHGLDDDVKNKYESGYCEGVLDDYSGDGSWNRNHRLLDMVNTCDSDIDVINSRLWIPVTISGFTGNGNPAGEDNPDSEFVLGEEVEVWLRDGLGAWEKPESVWIDSPPAVLHVGAGHHPKVPGPDSPQHDHSNSYIILGFEGKNFAEKNDYADEARLDVLGTVGNDQGKLVWLYGVTSGATALVSKVSSYIPDDDHPADEAGAWHTPAEQTYQTRSNPKHKHLFLLEHIWQGDKLLEYGPKSDPELTVTTYIPITGLPAEGDSAQGIDGLAQRSPIFEPATSAYALQVQMYPYTTEVDDDRQFVPSFNPGLLNKWSDLQDPVNENIVWGYTDAGPAAVNPLTEWALPTHAPSNPLRNVHIGMQFKARKDMHLTHGFCDFFIPGPKIVQIGPGATKQMRVEGYYFCDDDSTRVGIPPISADPAYPNGYGDPPNDGEIGGSWVFFRHSAESAIEVPVGEITFEVGVNPGRTVCGINAEQANQTSTGHILEVDIPPLPKEGYYDVIVRNFRPYKMGQNSSWTYHVDEDVIEKGYNHIAGEWSGGAWGTDPFGGGT